MASSGSAFDNVSISTSNNTVVGHSSLSLFTRMPSAMWNEIIWGNSCSSMLFLTFPTVSYSCIQPEYLAEAIGPNNISIDPCFVTGINGDYYLSQLESGQVYESPCVGAGFGSLAEGENLTTRTDSVIDTMFRDMGFHYIPIHCTNPLAADVNSDCVVDLVDLAELSRHWLECNASGYFCR